MTYDISRAAKYILKISDKGTKGLSSSEIEYLEKKLEIRFPNDFKELLKIVSPKAEGFYNWGDTSEDNMKYISSIIQGVKKELLDSFDDIYWPESFEKIELNKNFVLFSKMVDNAPNLIPIYGHRYIAESIDGGPIFSVHGADIIYYGENIDDYIKKEFFDEDTSEIDFSNVKKVPFWSELVEL